MTKNSPTITKSILINASSAHVWDALVNPDLLKVWMSDAEIEITCDWKVGSAMVVRGKANGNYEYKGEILAIEKEKLLRYSSWTKISRLPDLPENYSVIEFRLVTEQNQTSLSVSHSNLIAEAAVEHSNFYWNVALQEIKKITEESPINFQPS